MANFILIEALVTYNAVFGRPHLNTIQAVVLTYTWPSSPPYKWRDYCEKKPQLIMSLLLEGYQ